MPIVIEAGITETPCPSVCTPWAETTDVCGSRVDDLDPIVLADMLDVASDIYFFLAGRQYPGLCSDTVRPCAGAPAGIGCPGWWPGQWSSWMGSGCGCARRGQVACHRVPAVTLGAYPVDEITQVLLDGVVLDASEYAVRDERWLIRMADADGRRQTWPCCSRDDLPSTEEGTFEVAFVYGQMPPSAGKHAVAEMAYELTLACSTFEGECQLPKRVTSIVRQGVTETVVLDPMAFLNEGRTGLYLGDAFLQAVNPAKVTRRAALVMPGAPRPARIR